MTNDTQHEREAGSALYELAEYLTYLRGEAKNGPMREAPEMREHVANLERYMAALDAARQHERSLATQVAEVMPTEFADYIARNYSGEVVFSDPMWHAVRIWRAAVACGTTKPESTPKAEGLPHIMFDGFAVLQSLTAHQRARTSPENVTDVLDAVVKLLRTPQQTTQEAKP